MWAAGRCLQVPADDTVRALLCSRCTPGVHARCASQVCAPGVHARCARQVCMPGVHARCARQVRGHRQVSEVSGRTHAVLAADHTHLTALLSPLLTPDTFSAVSSSPLPPLPSHVTSTHLHSPITPPLKVTSTDWPYRPTTQVTSRLSPRHSFSACNTPHTKYQFAPRTPKISPVLTQRRGKPRGVGAGAGGGDGCYSLFVIFIFGPSAATGRDETALVICVGHRPYPRQN